VRHRAIRRAPHAAGHRGRRARQLGAPKGFRPKGAAKAAAREARVIRNRKWSQLVTVDVVRHDPLTPEVIVPSQVIPPDRTRQPA
jgi:hypothetical protein